MLVKVSATTNDLKVPTLRHTTIASSCYWLYDYGDALQGGLVLTVGTLEWALFFHVQHIFLSYMGLALRAIPAASWQNGATTRVHMEFDIRGV